MNYDSNLVRFFILAPIVPYLVILLFVFRKRLVRELFWFAVYLGSFVVMQIITFVIYQMHRPFLYFYATWIFEGISLSIAFMVILEIFRNVLFGYRALQKLAMVVLSLVGLVVLCIAVYVGTFGAPGSSPLVAFMLTMERSIRIIQIGFLITLFAFVSLMGLNWKNHVFGIALGYGLYACASLVSTAYAAYFGSDVGFKTLIIDQCAYLCMIGIWMTYVFQPQLARRVLFPDSAREDLQKWNDALTGLMRN